MNLFIREPDYIEVLCHFPVGHRGKVRIGFNPPIFPCLDYGIKHWDTLRDYCKQRSRDNGTVLLWCNRNSGNDVFLGKWYNGERIL